MQEIRLYYDFKDVDIDRYWIDGNYTEVMLSARELNVDLLPDNAQTWVNQHLKFTHGFGLAMSPVNAKDTEGLPVFYIKDIPPSLRRGPQDRRSLRSISARSPTTTWSSIRATPEFDYPARHRQRVSAFTRARGGVPVSGFWRRLLFSIFYRDINLLVTENIVAKSKIMIRRNITRAHRVHRAVPEPRSRPLPRCCTTAGWYWIVDCYTTSDHYPYSQRNADGINYIRNSVKVVVDAYTGATDLYVADPDDPMIQTWERIFPAMFKPLSRDARRICTRISAIRRISS